MAQDHIFTLSHEFDAPVEKVFEAWTDTDQFKQWFAPQGYSLLFAKADIKPGGEIHYSMTSKIGIEIWRKLFYKDVIAPAKLSYTLVYSNKKAVLNHTR